MYKYYIRYQNGGVCSFEGGQAKEGKKAFHIKSETCTILVPYAWYKDSEVKELVA